MNQQQLAKLSRQLEQLQRLVNNIQSAIGQNTNNQNALTSALNTNEGGSDGVTIKIFTNRQGRKNRRSNRQGNNNRRAQ